MKTYALELNDLEPEAREFYRQAITIMAQSGIPFLIGGAYGFGCYTSIVRHTKDLDLFVHPQDVERVFEVFVEQGYETKMEISRWLGKVIKGDMFVDIIFSSDNGIAEVDDLWFKYAHEGQLLGMPVKLIPPEEMIWSKGYLMERYRFDGADVIHLFHALAEELDWRRLLYRFGSHWRLLFSHVVVYGFVYPTERARIPEWVMEEFINRMQEEITQNHPGDPLCNGTLIAPTQYLHDVERGKYDDAMPLTTGMTAKEIVEAGAKSEGE